MPSTQQPNSVHRLGQLLQAAFRQQAAEVGRLLSLRVLTDEDVPRLDQFPERMAALVKPMLTQLTQQGIVQSRRRLAGLQGGRFSEAVFRIPQRIAIRNGHTFGPRLKQLGVSFDVFDPLVLRAVDKATLVFCEETNETAVGNLKDAVKKLRKLLKEGLEQGKAVAVLAREIRRIFADPQRAYVIAATESARAIHAGALLNAKESSLKLKKEWLASSNACGRCQDLHGVQKKLDQPFTIDGTGPYARIMHPPLHPHCTCDWTEVLA